MQMPAHIPHFKNPELLELALTHSSFRFENKLTANADNERLEFLGDAVLQMYLSNQLYKDFPDLSEGVMSRIRASLVNEAFLFGLALNIGLDQKTKFGKGELASGGNRKPRLLASTLEAIIGAYYLDSGFDAVCGWLHGLFAGPLASVDIRNPVMSDYKTQLQERMQKIKHQTPVYETLGEVGPDHEKTFTVAVKVSEVVLAHGTGKSKKQAEQNAAQNAIQTLPTEPELGATP